MTLKKFSRDPFASLFWNSVKKSCFVPIASLTIFLIYIVANTASVLSAPESLQTFVNGDGVTLRSGFCMDFMYTGLLATGLMIVGGMLAGIILFRFAQSRKQCNVIFSLGLSRRKIFLAKYLGGVIPFAAVMFFFALLEILSNAICGVWIGFPIISLTLWTVITSIAVYTLAFTITSAATAFSGNIVEGTLFTLILGIFPNISHIFIADMCGVFIHGALPEYNPEWNFFNPFASMLGIDGITDFPLTAGRVLHRLCIGSGKMTVYTWSGTITALVLTAVILTVCLLTFPKRKNENSGTFARSRGLNEVCGAITAFYAATFAVAVIIQRQISEIMAYCIMIVVFAFIYLAFKLIFARKRMKIFVQSVKRLVAYTAAFAVVTVIFSTGFFGFSSYIPDAKDVKYLEIYVELPNPYATANYETDIVRRENMGYVQMQSIDGSYISTSGNYFFDNLLYATVSNPRFLIDDEEEIKQIIDLHNEIVSDGKLKANGNNTCGYGFMIEYKLKGDKTVKRYYRSMSFDNALKLLELSDLPEFKSNISEFLDYIEMDESEIDSGSIPNGFCLYSKDLKKCKFINGVPGELKNAVLDDLMEQSAHQIFFHTPEDELGVIKFSVIDIIQEYMNIDSNSFLEFDGEIMDGETLEPVGKVWDIGKKLSALTESSLSTAYGNCIVVTKSMKNTIGYLTENNLMQYFTPKTTADDVKEIRIATRAESVGKNNGDMLPMFAAGYATASEVQSSKSKNSCFASHVDHPITNKEVIQTVLDNAQLYGCNSNEDRVVEVTFNDGSIATYAISAEVYSKLNIT